MAGDPQVVVARDLGAELTDIVGPGHATPAPRDLLAGLAGASAAPGPGPQPPAWLVRPGSPAEIAALVRLADSAGAVVIPVGTATRRPTARGTGRPRFVVDVKRLAHVLFLDETSLVVQVQAGLTGLGLEELLLPRGLTLGDFPPAALRSTIGGMLSVRTPGKVSPRHGVLEEAVLGVSAVLADGRTVHTRVAPRRATGPDLARLLLGSEGTLGVIVGATLRIHRRAEARLLDAARLPSVAAACDAVMAALRRDARPAAVRIFEAGEARAHLGGDVAKSGDAILVSGTVGPPDLAALDREILAEEARARGAVALGPGPAEIWWRRRFGHPVPGPLPPPAALEIAAGPTQLARVADAVLAAASSAGRTARPHISRFAADGACIFVTLIDPSDGGGRPDPVGPARARVEEAARAAGGHLVGEVDPAFDVYRAALKTALDPHHVFGE